MDKKFMCNANCTYATNDKKVELSIDTLFKVVQTMPRRPKILTMKIDILKRPGDSYIILSEDVAEALEGAIKKAGE